MVSRQVWLRWRWSILAHVDDTLAATSARTLPATFASPSEASDGDGNGLLAGRIIGGYRLLSPLGSGGMGVVYTAHDARLDRLVALKLVRQGSGTDGSFGRDELLREAQTLACLAHPNVVAVYEVSEYDGQVVVAMELVRGETLDLWQRQPERQLGEILGAYRQAAQGLQAAHALGLVHRDFKPANAILGRDGRVRVIDFGLACALGPEPTGVTAGTPAYMAPEQFLGVAVDARSDIFSLCVALWEAIFGMRPFAGTTISELRDNVCAGRRLPAPSHVRIPDRLLRALERGLATDPAERHADLGPLLAALAWDPAADPSAASRERRIAFAVVAGVIGFVVIPAVAFNLTYEVFDRRLFHAAVSVLGCATILSVSWRFRRTLLRNAYHRRLMGFLSAFLGLIAAQRVLGFMLDAPERQMFLDGGMLLAGMLVAGAIFFARWMAVLAGFIGVAMISGLTIPGVYPTAYLVVGPVFFTLFGYFWQRDAKGHGPRQPA